MSTANQPVEQLRESLRALGFDVVRFARVEGEAPGAGAFRTWLEAGNNAGMAWLAREPARRCDPTLVLPGARSLVVLGVNYCPPAGLERGPAEQAGSPAWARYALYQDYHDTITPALAKAGLVLESTLGLGPSDHRYYTDTGPVLERAWAARAGLGFTGKNAMLISRTHGNWLLLAAILVRADLPADAPLTAASADASPGALCGKCTRCLDACPTRALTAPGRVDSRLCISYLTIENKGGIPLELRPLIGDRLYGCDICAEVCPWNRFAQEATPLLLSASRDFAKLPLGRILEMDTVAFAAAFKGSPIKRIKRVGLLRNACVVAGNIGGAELLPVLDSLAGDPAEPEMLREHAAWGAFRIRGRG